MLLKTLNPFFSMPAYNRRFQSVPIRPKDGAKSTLYLFWYVLWTFMMYCKVLSVPSFWHYWKKLIGSPYNSRVEFCFWIFQIFTLTNSTADKRQSMILSHLFDLLEKKFAFEELWNFFPSNIFIWLVLALIRVETFWHEFQKRPF